MRLLNTSTLELHEFLGEAVPDYAILSHRWDSEEVSYQDLQDGRGRKMPGYAKIERCCETARLDGWQYVWIDSCCIDKTSSAELSESINSMYQWYKDAQNGEQVKHDLRKSEWFRRGWTLQELLAPSIVVFFDHDWVDIGTKGSLQEVISEITGIQDFVNFETACVAQKMSWAAGRETTRVEDIAYCLMGLFDVHIPPLYGEGKGAFMRLQLEILKMSDDESIFAWTQKDDIGGLLASSPKAFRDSGKVRPLESKGYDIDRLNFFHRESRPFSMTNKGLSISFLLIPTEVVYFLIGDASKHQNLFVAPLNCSWMGDGRSRPTIFLLKIGTKDKEEYKRTYFPKLLLLNSAEVQFAWERSMFFQNSHRFTQKTLYIKQESRKHLRANPRVRKWTFSVDVQSLRKNGFEPSREDLEIVEKRGQLGSSTWNTITLTLDLYSHVGYRKFPGLRFENTKIGENIVLVLGAQNYSHPWIILLASMGKTTVEDIIDAVEEEGSAPFIRAWKTSDTVVAMAAAPESASSDIKPGGGMKPPLDRISQPLKNGQSTSARMRKVGVEGEKQFSVDLSIDPRGTLHWPAPVWLDNLPSLIGTDEGRKRAKHNERVKDFWENPKPDKIKIGKNQNRNHNSDYRDGDDDGAKWALFH